MNALIALLKQQIRKNGFYHSTRYIYLLQCIEADCKMKIRSKICFYYYFAKS
jgi:hypothetical protein